MIVPETGLIDPKMGGTFINQLAQTDRKKEH